MTIEWKDIVPKTEDQLLIKDLRRIIKEQEECIKTLQLKNNQLEIDNVQMKRCLELQEDSDVRDHVDFPSK